MRNPYPKPTGTLFMTQEAIVETFCTKAAVVGAKVTTLKNEDEALAYVLQIAESKKPCEILAEEPNTEKGPLTADGIPTRLNRIVTAPGLEPNLYAKLEKACTDKGYLCLEKGLRNYLAGVDIGFGTAECAVAASGTCLVNSDSEEKRLATMMSEICIFMLKKSTIYPELFDITPILREMQQKPGAYSAFISGPSRTADIERVPAVGVHGPLELHILILEDA